MGYKLESLLILVHGLLGANWVGSPMQSCAGPCVGAQNGQYCASGTCRYKWYQSTIQLSAEGVGWCESQLAVEPGAALVLRGVGYSTPPQRGDPAERPKATKEIKSLVGLAPVGVCNSPTSPVSGVFPLYIRCWLFSI